MCSTKIKLRGLNGVASHVLDGKNKIVIGRNPNAAVVLRNLFISRNHCEILAENGAWKIRDMSSSGTYVNLKLIGKNNDGFLVNGDKICLGPPDGHENVSWTFIYEDAAVTCPSFDDTQCDLEAQSQVIAVLHEEKINLESKMSHQGTEMVKMQRKLQESEAKYKNRLKDIEERQVANRGSVHEMYSEEQSMLDDEEKAAIEKEWADEKDRLEGEIETYKAAEGNLKDEVERLKSSLENEKLQWELKISEMKENLEEVVRNKDKDVQATRDEMSSASLQKQTELSDRLAKQEKEKQEMADKLEAMKKQFEDEAAKIRVEREKFELEKQRELEQKTARLVEYHKNQMEQVQQDKQRIESDFKAVLEEKKQLEAKKDESKNTNSDVIENMLENELQCSICNEMFITAMTLNCTHIFCKYCLNEWKKNQRTCPVCRTPITSENRALALDNFIDSVVAKIGEDFKKKRDIIVAERRRDEAPPTARGRGRGRGVRGRSARAAANANIAYNANRRQNRRSTPAPTPEVYVLDDSTVSHEEVVDVSSTQESSDDEDRAMVTGEEEDEGDHDSESQSHSPQDSDTENSDFEDDWPRFRWTSTSSVSSTSSLSSSSTSSLIASSTSSLSASSTSSLSASSTSSLSASSTSSLSSSSTSSLSSSSTSSLSSSSTSSLSASSTSSLSSSSTSSLIASSTSSLSASSTSSLSSSSTSRVSVPVQVRDSNPSPPPYGYCYICGDPSHWSPNCPSRRLRW